MVYQTGDVSKIVGDLRIICVKGDLGATFGSIATEIAKYGRDADTRPTLAVMENTNVTGAGVRLYIYAPGTGWKYAALS